MAELLQTLIDLAATVQLNAVVALLIGLSAGILIGVLPGMGPLLGTILAIPFTFYMEPVPAIAMLLGIYQGGNYGGAITATVLGIPGTPMSAITLLEAYPMALRGKASEAVTLAAVASFFGTVFGGIILILISNPLAKVATSFGPAETMALALLGLTAIAALSQESFIKGLLAGLFGLSIATIGNDPITGFTRFNFGRTELEGGVMLVSMFMGIFAVSEFLIQIEKPIRAFQATKHLGITFSMFKTLGTRIFEYVRSGIVGVVIGSIPVVGNTTSAFLSYKLAKDFSKHPETFGKGEPDGVIASEAANSACCGGALIPMLALGIPGDPVIAVVMGGLLIQGLAPGPMLFFTQAEALTGIFAAFLIGGMLLLPMGLASISIFIRVLKAPLSMLLANVLALIIIGTFLVQRYLFDLWALWFFGALGYAMRKTGFSLVPVVIGFVLGPIFEVNLRRTTIVMSGDFLGYILTRPIALGVLILAAITLVFPLLQSWYLRLKKRRAESVKSSDRKTA
jgi:putative tricarboxylic transport membrane protein